VRREAETPEGHDPLIGGSKVCSRCKESKAALYFSAKRASHDGLADWCRSCCSAYEQKRTKKWKKRVAATMKQLLRVGAVE